MVNTIIVQLLHFYKRSKKYIYTTEGFVKYKNTLQQMSSRGTVHEFAPFPRRQSQEPKQKGTKRPSAYMVIQIFHNNATQLTPCYTSLGSITRR